MRFRQRCEAILHDDNDGKARIKGSPHHALFTRGNGGGYEDGTLSGSPEITGGLFCYLTVVSSPRHTHGHSLGSGKQISVAYTAKNM